jgi:Tfp pilus assembly protein PilF
MGAVRYRSIREIKETLQVAKSRKRGCTLLIGAGCSVTAGIPTAAGFVNIIRDEHQLAFERAAAKTYPGVMSELLLTQRRDLIASYVDAAQINWAHLGIALLMQAGYVDRVLTTNFDLLVVRACAVLGVFPAVYDFASSQLLKRSDIPDQAIFYLHGQRTGFVLMNTDEDMNRHAKLLGPVFDDAGAGRVWIVVGYSGENDPVFRHLADTPRFDNGLFWVGYQNSEPAPHVRDQLLSQDKDAFYTKGFDADAFFVALTRELEIFPPDIVARPFTYLERALSGIAPFAEPGGGGSAFDDDVMRTPRAWIRNAIEEFEQPAWEIITQGTSPPLNTPERGIRHTMAARYLLMAGRYEEVLAFRKEYDASPSPEFANVLSIAYVMHGNALLDRAKSTSIMDEAAGLFAEARQNYEAALAVKPDRSEALHNWGNLLLDEAKRAAAPDADVFFNAAAEKYQQALALDPMRQEVLVNWGNLLLDRAKSAITFESSSHFFAEAEQKYQAALKIKPDMPAVLISWGNLLLDRGKAEGGAQAARLFRDAETKYKQALERRPNMHEAFSLWGNVLLDLAKNTAGSESLLLFDAAEEKFRAALAIKPDMYDALNNWGSLLLDRAKRHRGTDAADLFSAAEKKYEEALTVRPGAPDVLLNLANLYRDWAATADQPEAQRLITKADDAVGRADAALRGHRPVSDGGNVTSASRQTPPEPST